VQRSSRMPLVEQHDQIPCLFRPVDGHPTEAVIVKPRHHPRVPLPLRRTDRRVVRPRSRAGNDRDAGFWFGQCRSSVVHEEFGTERPADVVARVRSSSRTGLTVCSRGVFRLIIPQHGPADNGVEQAGLGAVDRVHVSGATPALPAIAVIVVPENPRSALALERGAAIAARWRSRRAGPRLNTFVLIPTRLPGVRGCLVVRCSGRVGDERGRAYRTGRRSRKGGSDVALSQF
jgi:hypothetical protein